MTRISLISHSEVSSELREVIERSRGSKNLAIDGLLLHSPPTIRAWHGLFQALAHAITFDFRLRELAVLRIAILNRARYQYHQHLRIAASAGICREDIDALQEWSACTSFDERERALLKYVDQITMNVQVDDATFHALKVYFDERQLVEITATIAGYNMVSRFMEALDLQPSDDELQASISVSL